MYRGTTPTYTFTLPDEVDLTLADKVYVTFAKMDETIIYTKENDDIEITAHSVEVYLTQEETLALPDGRIKVQLNWLYEDESHTKRACSNKIVINTQKNLLNYVLGDEGGGGGSDFSTVTLTLTIDATNATVPSGATEREHILLSVACVSDGMTRAGADTTVSLTNTRTYEIPIVLYQGKARIGDFNYKNGGGYHDIDWDNVQLVGIPNFDEWQYDEVEDTYYAVITSDCSIYLPVIDV